MQKYQNKTTREIVKAFQLVEGDIEAILLAGGTCRAVVGDYMIVREGNVSECSRKNFESNFIETKND